jgi:hypothetical protein
MMPKTADILRHRMAAYRKQLSEGVDADVARDYGHHDLVEVIANQVRIDSLSMRMEPMLRATPQK